MNALIVGQQYLRVTVVGYRVGERRELGRAGNGNARSDRVEAKMGDRVDLEDRIFGLISYRRVARECPGGEFLGRALTFVPVGCVHTRK